MGDSEMWMGTPSWRASCLLGGALGLTVGCGGFTDGADLIEPPPLPVPDAGASGPASFSIVVLPDTQHYAQSHPEIFDAQTRWIAQQAAALPIAFVLHTGDIVDHAPSQLQWRRASDAFRALDGVIPYVIAAGNHDLLTVPGKGLTFDAPLMNSHFPVTRFRPQPWLQGTFEPDHIQNSYHLLRAGGRDYLVLSLEFGPRDAVLDWASGILRQHAATPAFVITHAYMYLDGQRYDQNLTGACGGQCFGPHAYGLPEPVNDGEQMWQKLVSRHDNVQFVLSGHMLGNAASRRRSERPSGTHVHEMLANYQTCGVYDPGRPQDCLDPETGKPTKGGDGYLRLMTFDPDRHTVAVKTYSPHLDAFKTSPANQFELELDR
jgi:hypothetical protein